MCKCVLPILVPMLKPFAVSHCGVCATRLCLRHGRKTMGGDGFFLDVTGASHLFGGEQRCSSDLGAPIAHFGLTARCALAETPGAAWALSRFHQAPPVILQSGEEKQAFRLCPSKPCASIPKPAPPCAGSASRPSVFDRRPRAPFAARFDAKFSPVLIRHSALPPSRSISSFRLPSMMPPAIARAGDPSG